MKLVKHLNDCHNRDIEIVIRLNSSVLNRTPYSQTSYQTKSRKVERENRRLRYVKKCHASPEVNELAQRRYALKAPKEEDPALRATQIIHVILYSLCLAIDQSRNDVHLNNEIRGFLTPMTRRGQLRFSNSPTAE